MPIGTIVNTIAVLIGGFIGTRIHKKFPERFREIIFQGIGLFTLFMGVSMFLKAKEPMSIIAALLLGGLTGEFLKIETRMDSIADRLKEKFFKENERFSEGILTAFLLFCVGSLTIVGAIEEGLNNNHSLLLTKAILDGVVSIPLASTLGIGVPLSAIPLFIFQIAITLLAILFRNLFSPVLIAQLSATGGILIVGLGIGLLDIKKLRLANLLPSLVYIVLITLVLERFFPIVLK